MQQEPSPHYGLAKTIVHLSAAVGAADAAITAPEVQALHQHVDNVLAIPAGEQDRLYAYLVWLNAQPVRLTGLRQQIAAMTAAQRTATGDLLLTIATADGSVSPEEIKVLGSIFRMLDLDTASIPSQLHESMTSDIAPAQPEPVRVAPMVPLDPALIARKLEETAVVSSLLADVFADDDDELSEVPDSRADALPIPAEDMIEGLDGSHSRLLRRVLAQDSWDRTHFAHIADELGLMPDGAIDILNEYALDMTGDLLLEGDDPLDLVEGTRQSLPV